MHAVVIGFEYEQYSVGEGDGSVDVCVAVKSGALQRTAIVSVCTEMSTAIGKSCVHQYQP